MYLTQIRRFIRQWREFNSALRELSGLSDRELKDIGINRGDIVRIAWHNADQ